MRQFLVNNRYAHPPHMQGQCWIQHCNFCSPAYSEFQSWEPQWLMGCIEPVNSARMARPKYGMWFVSRFLNSLYPKRLKWPATNNNWKLEDWEYFGRDSTLHLHWVDAGNNCLQHQNTPFQHNSPNFPEVSQLSVIKCYNYSTENYFTIKTSLIQWSQ